MTIALRIDPEDQTVDPGREAVFTIHVVNQSGVVDRVAFDILGSAGGWLTTQPQAVALFPGTDATTTMVIAPPLGTPLGPVPLGVRATAETSGFVEIGEANLNVGASRTVEAELRPRTATGKRRATSVVFLHNLGNAPTKVQVVATDPDDAIVFDAPSAVQIGPGMTTELPLRMRLPSREKQGATLPYQVLVEGGDTAQSLDGQVRQPPKKRWPLMVVMALVALLAAAYLLLKPEDSVALRDGNPDAPTTTTIAATTIAPEAAATTAAPAPGATQPGGAPAPGPGGGAATTAAPGGGAATTRATTATVAGPIGGVVPTRSPTTVAPLCPGTLDGSAQKTAQRVLCAYEGGTLAAELNKTVSQAAIDQMSKIPKIGGQVASTPTAATGGTRVPFTGCKTGSTNGIASMFVSSTTKRVESVTACNTPVISSGG